MILGNGRKRDKNRAGNSVYSPNYGKNGESVSFPIIIRHMVGSSKTAHF